MWIKSLDISYYQEVVSTNVGCILVFDKSKQPSLGQGIQN